MIANSNKFGKKRNCQGKKIRENQETCFYISFLQKTGNTAAAVEIQQQTRLYKSSFAILHVTDTAGNIVHIKLRKKNTRYKLIKGVSFLVDNT